MSKLLLCALLAVASLAQADSVLNRYGAGEQSGELSTPGGDMIIAQVAAETAQLLPSSRPGAIPSSKVTRAAKPRVVARSPKTRSGTAYHSTSPKTKRVNGRPFTPSPVPSKYKNDAEQFAKANGCSVPVATMKLAVVGPDNFESFAVTCEAAAPMSIRCDSGRCRAM